MRDPTFWWRGQSLPALLLGPVGEIYGRLAAARMTRSGARIGVPVVCVGNPTLGGAGKTPTAIAIAQGLIAAGQRPAFLTRGYGGSLRGPVVVSKAHTAREVGDEPLLLRMVAPTVVARDRLAGALMAQQAGASVVVMDDGFQNPALAKDASVLVIDARRGVGNGRVFPAGPLRAPLAPQLERADAILIIGKGGAGQEVTDTARAASKPVYQAALAPSPQSLAMLKEGAYLAFAGIGDPEKFFATLDEVGIAAPLRRAFADHHPFSAAEARELLATAAAHDLTPLTTEKDLARMTGEPALADLRARTRVLPVALAIENNDEFRALLRDKLNRRRETP